GCKAAARSPCSTGKAPTRCISCAAMALPTRKKRAGSRRSWINTWPKCAPTAAIFCAPELTNSACPPTDTPMRSTAALSPSSLRASWDRIPTRLWDAALILLALIVRFWRLGYHSVWFDEAVSLGWAQSDLRHTWAVTMRLVEDKHPPIYYTLLHFWQRMLAW